MKHTRVQRRLLSEKDKLRQFLCQITIANNESWDGISPDIVEEANRELMNTVNFFNGSDVSQKIKSIETALSLLKSGRYGICQGCGRKISEKRLEAVPWALFCIGCQEKREKV